MAKTSDLKFPNIVTWCQCGWHGPARASKLVWFNHQPVQTLEVHCPNCDDFLREDHDE